MTNADHEHDPIECGCELTAADAPPATTLAPDSRFLFLLGEGPKPTGRIWAKPEEPEDVVLVRDASGFLWQHCRDTGWDQVDEYRQAGMPRVGSPWGHVLSYGPLTELEPPE